MNRRWYACSVFVFLVLTAACSSAADRPNVVIILTDDHGTLDANCFDKSREGESNLSDPSNSLVQKGLNQSGFFQLVQLATP